MSYICFIYYLLGVTGIIAALVVASSLLRIAFLILVFIAGSAMMILFDFYFLGFTYIIVYVGAILILFLFVIMMVQIKSLVIFLSSSFMNKNRVVNYFYPAWSIEYKTMTDLETLANILYVGYPTAFILISVALWVVMIGIIQVTGDTLSIILVTGH